LLALLLVGVLLALGAGTASAGTPGLFDRADQELLSHCAAAPSPASDSFTIVLRRLARPPWGFALRGRADAFSPGEALVSWVVDPGQQQPFCLDSGRASATGGGTVTVAFWYQASSPGRYTVCLSGAVSRRTRCGSITVS
jgi:hypothetical protein